MKKRLQKPYYKQQFGCDDQQPPSENTEEQLSRIYDMLFNAEHAGLSDEQVLVIWQSLPESTKLEFNFSNWKYQYNSNVPMTVVGPITSI